MMKSDVIIELDSVCKTYQQGQSTINVLKDFSFQVTRGESLSIVGPSGSGKSTLLSLLAGLDAPDAGRVIVQKKD